MYVKISCPHCEKVLKVKEEYLGKKTRCPYCHGAFLLTGSMPEDSSDSRAGLTTEASGEVAGAGPAGKADGTNVSPVLTAILGLGLTAFFYCALVLPVSLWKPNHKLGVFFRESWVQYAIIFLGSWAIGMLLLKSRKLARQKESLLFDALPADISRVIRPDNAHTFQRHIRALPHDFRERFLLNRVYRALENFRARGSIQEVTTLLSSQAEIDGSAVQSSYAFLKVLIWAIPILGFIGTVIGIGQAVGGFSAALAEVQEIAKIKAALGDVTKGLATAFDTTYLALVVSLLVMFPASSIEKAEDEVLISVEEYCNENLLSRMQDVGSEKTKDSAQIRQAVSDALAEHQVDFKRRLKYLKAIGHTVTQQVADGWEAVHRQLQGDQSATLQQFHEVLSAVSEERRSFVNQVKTIQETQLGQFRDGIASLGTTATEIQRQIAALQEKQVRNFGDVVAALREDLKGLQDEGHRWHQAQESSLQELVSRLGRTVEDVSGKATAVQTEMTETLHATTTNQQALLQRFDGMIKSLGDQSQALVIKSLALESSRQDAAETVMAALQAEREASAKSTAQQLTEVSRVGNELVASLSDCQRRFSTDIGKLAETQQKVAVYLDRLMKSDSFTRKLFGIEESLGRLASDVDDVSARVKASPLAADTADGGRKTGLWRWFLKGNSHG